MPVCFIVIAVIYRQESAALRAVAMQSREQE